MAVVLNNRCRGSDHDMPCLNIRPKEFVYRLVLPLTIYNKLCLSIAIATRNGLLGVSALLTDYCLNAISSIRLPQVIVYRVKN